MALDDVFDDNVKSVRSSKYTSVNKSPRVQASPKGDNFSKKMSMFGK
jgi:hypothetical protein